MYILHRNECSRTLLQSHVQILVARPLSRRRSTHLLVLQVIIDRCRSSSNTSHMCNLRLVCGEVKWSIKRRSQPNKVYLEAQINRQSIKRVWFRLLQKPNCYEVPTQSKLILSGEAALADILVLVLEGVISESPTIYNSIFIKYIG